jgi:hypothetical protein
MKTWLSFYLLDWAMRLMPECPMKEQIYVAQRWVRRYERYKAIVRSCHERPVSFQRFFDFFSELEAWQ